MKLMILAAALAVAPFSLSQACDAKGAVRAYYSGPDTKSVKVAQGANGLFFVSWSEENGVRCEGAAARVNDSCQVEVVSGALCNYAN